MAIYTKNGDKGETSIATGQKISKDDLLIEAIGTIDELNSWMGMIKSGREPYPQASSWKTSHRVQRNLFLINAILAGSPQTRTFPFPDEEVEFMEKYMDYMEGKLPPISKFIYPGTTPLSAHYHVARSLARRAERRVVALSKELPVPENILKYLNRLSDYLFVRARSMANLAGYRDREWDIEKFAEMLNDERQVHKNKK